MPLQALPIIAVMLKHLHNKFKPLPVLVIAVQPIKFCSGNTAILFSFRRIRLICGIQDRLFLLFPTSPLATTIYTVTGTTNGLPAPMELFTQPVLQPPTLHVRGQKKVICTGETLTLTASGANTYTWNVPASNSNTVR